MEPDNFATIIHGKANRISRVLIYAILEWTLIFFLLLNSLFSYLILKFALYFGLKPPCLLCSRLDHIFKPHNSEPCYTNLICEQHSVELSKSGYCFSHRKLVESQDMCVDCSPSPLDSSSTDKQLTCSCCGATIKSKDKPTHFVIEPTQMGNLVSEDGFVGDFDLDVSSREFQMGNSDQGFLLSLSKGGFSLSEAEAKERSLVSNAAIRCAYENDSIVPQHLEFYIDNDDYGLIPVELLNLDQEEGSQLWRETDDELVFEPDMAVLPAGLVDGKHNLNSSCLDFLKLDELNAEDFPRNQAKEEFEMEDDVLAVRLLETKIETLATINGAEEELSKEVAASVRSDEAKIETLAIINGPIVDINEEIAGTIIPDEAKIETLSTINDLEEDFNGEIAGTIISVEPKIETLPTINGREEDINEEIACTLISDEAKIETLPTINGQEDDLNGEIAGAIISDETGIGTLPTINGPEEEFIKEFAATMNSDEAKIEDLMIEENFQVEKFPTIQGQAEETKREIYLEAAVDQEPCVSLTNTNDHVTEMREVNELDVKLPRRDSGLLYHKESDEVGINDGMINSIEPSTTSVVCDASDTTCDLLEIGHYGSTKTSTDEGDTNKENGLNEAEDERIPDTPTSIDSFQLLHRRLLSIGRSKAPNEGSLDGSIVNDTEYGNGEVTMEELKSELKAERKAFHALYEELEEERNAAAISASQTMAMINRLQEEKAAIEMEALQYQRMMEEQAEYDHEALQLMNEILVKREKEKVELEMELETCMNKLMDYEEKDKSLSASCRNEEEVDAIVNMKDSLSCFEEERISILNQLKVLEENLCTLADEEEHQIHNLNSFEQFYTNGEHHQEREMNGSKALVSDNEFFDEDGGCRLDPFLLDGIPLTQFGSEKRRFTIEEEVERLYERLNALEEDKEFIKHCLGSLRKGDRGIHLLQEILQHLRDLKRAEFRARNAVDGVC
ncbi:hypothetical protein V2J09_003522 [Rumex salicifolius]